MNKPEVIDTTEQQGAAEACGIAWADLQTVNDALDACKETGKPYLYRICLGVVVLAARRYAAAVEQWQEQLEGEAR